ncbi:hypothetical protein VTL71DRAFT_8898 [Oculimacula yallundae]|uniref:MYND-type domain-containing protein n=1 Tax=Oculimacula yallundae TaxID=86028 RepID=A0ABR4BUF3_9HELO
MECANCKKPGKFACAQCEECPVTEGDSPIVHYCSAKCQKDDDVKHLPTCQRLQDRLTLYRVGRIAQKLFFIYKEITWSQLKIDAIEKRGQLVTLRGLKFEDSTWPEDYKIFPSHLVSSEEEREALLCYRACREALSWVIEFVDGFLKSDNLPMPVLTITNPDIDIATKMEHVDLCTKNDKQIMILVPPGVNMTIIGGPTHEIIKVTLRSGEEFAIDITAPQYGCSDIVVPWKLYEGQRVLQVVSKVPAPRSIGLLQYEDYTIHAMIRAYQLMQSKTRQNKSVDGDTISAMNFHFLEWQTDEGQGLKTMVKLSNTRFERKMTDLVNFMHWKFNSVPDQIWGTVNGKKQAQTLRNGKWVHRK